VTSDNWETLHSWKSPTLDASQLKKKTTPLVVSPGAKFVVTSRIVYGLETDERILTLMADDEVSGAQRRFLYMDFTSRNASGRADGRWLSCWRGQCPRSDGALAELGATGTLTQSSLIEFGKEGDLHLYRNASADKMLKAASVVPAEAVKVEKPKSLLINTNIDSRLDPEKAKVSGLFAAVMDVHELFLI
jgi:hypothetical protein